MGRPSNKEQRREQIIVAFIDALAAHGYEATSMARLGKAAGLQPSLMHYYFPSKQHILLASVPHLERAYLARRDRFVRPGATPRQRLEGLIDAHLAIDASTNTGYVAAWIQIMALAQLDPETGRVLRDVLKARHDELTACFASDAMMQATGVLATILGMFQIAALRPELVRSGGAAELVKRQFHA